MHLQERAVVAAIIVLTALGYGGPALAQSSAAWGLCSNDGISSQQRITGCTLVIQAGFRRVDSLTGGDIVGRKGGNSSGIVIPYFRRAQTTFASTACAVIILISNTIPPATSSRGRSTSVRRAGPICRMSCPASNLGFSTT